MLSQVATIICSRAHTQPRIKPLGVHLARPDAAHGAKQQTTAETSLIEHYRSGRSLRINHFPQLQKLRVVVKHADHSEPPNDQHNSRKIPTLGATHIMTTTSLIYSEMANLTRSEV